MQHSINKFMTMSIYICIQPEMVRSFIYYDLLIITSECDHVTINNIRKIEGTMLLDTRFYYI